MTIDNSRSAELRALDIEWRELKKTKRLARAQVDAQDAKNYKERQDEVKARHSYENYIINKKTDDYAKAKQRLETEAAAETELGHPEAELQTTP